MKKPNSNFGRSGLTLVEVLVVIVVLAVLVAMLLPATVGNGRSKMARCLSNLHEMLIAFTVFANDNNGEFPMQIPVAKGGTMEFAYSGHTFPHFEKMRAYGTTLQMLICPAETNRQAATSFKALNDLNLSYFVNVDASTNDPSHVILVGDRFLQVGGQPAAHGLLNVTSNLNLSWTRNFHGSGGNFAFADGHVESSRDNNLASQIASQPLATNRFSIP